LVGIGIVLWLVGLGVALPPLGSAYVSTNTLLPIVGTVPIVIAAIKR
jgi:hypothetical protein